MSDHYKLQRYQAELQNIKHELKNVPKGYLTKKRNSYIQIVEKRGGTKTEIYITKNTPLIKRLARKKYCIERVKQLEQFFTLPLNQLDSLQLLRPAELIATFSDAYRSLPIEYFWHPTSEMWINQVFPENSATIEKNQMSNQGVAIQSKSEVIAANLLEEYHLIYHYDVPLYLKGRPWPVFPDFIIRNPFSTDTFTWEHLGGFHLDDYHIRVDSKMKAYHANDYKPFKNLIYTYEADIGKPTYLREIIEEIIF